MLFETEISVDFFQVIKNLVTFIKDKKLWAFRNAFSTF